jgi:hypothetical protein
MAGIHGPFDGSRGSNSSFAERTKKRFVMAREALDAVELPRMPSPSRSPTDFVRYRNLPVRPPFAATRV